MANSDHGRTITDSASVQQPGGVRNTDRQQISPPPSYEAYHNYVNYELPSYQSTVPSVPPVSARPCSQILVSPHQSIDAS